MNYKIGFSQTTSFVYQYSIMWSVSKSKTVLLKYKSSDFLLFYYFARCSNSYTILINMT